MTLEQKKKNYETLKGLITAYEASSGQERTVVAFN